MRKPQMARDAVSEDQLQALQSRLEALHEAQLLTDVEVESLEDAVVEPLACWRWQMKHYEVVPPEIFLLYTAYSFRRVHTSLADLRGLSLTQRAARGDWQEANQRGTRLSAAQRMAIRYSEEHLQTAAEHKLTSILALRAAHDSPFALGKPLEPREVRAGGGWGELSETDVLPFCCGFDLVS